MNFIKKIKVRIFKKYILRKILSKILVKSENSRTYSKFCKLVYGKNLTQFNMANMDQINKLIEILNLDENSKVLDLGCATGKITEYISDLTNAEITGIDYVKTAIKKAKERTLNEKNKLTFLHMNMNNLKFSINFFDTIIAIDTIYFVDNLGKTIGKLKNLLKANGTLAIFFSQIIKPDESSNMLLPENTKLAIALKKNNLKYEIYDFTESEKNHWRKSKEVAKNLKGDFEKEGNIDIYYYRIYESEKWLKYVDSNRISRYLYHIKA